MDLRNKRPGDTFQYIVTTDGNQLFTGTGSLITSLVISSITSSHVTESFATQSYILSIDIETVSLTASFLSASSGVFSRITSSNGLFGTSSFANTASFANNGGVTSVDTRTGAVTLTDKYAQLTASNRFTALQIITGSAYGALKLTNDTIAGTVLFIDGGPVLEWGDSGSGRTLGQLVGNSLANNSQAGGIVLYGDKNSGIGTVLFVSGSDANNNTTLAQIDAVTTDGVNSSIDIQTIKGGAGYHSHYTNESGNTGIGTNTPGATLHVQGNISGSSFTGSLKGTASWAQNAIASGITFISTSSTAPAIQTTMSAWLAISASGQRFYIPIYQ